MGKIEQKIKALLELANNNTNENEAQSALLKAQELLAKYEISMQSVKAHEEETKEVVEEKMDYMFNGRNKWLGTLSSVIATNYGCKLYFLGARSLEVVFMGKPERVQICKLAFNYAYEIINKESRKIANKLRKEGLSGTNVRNDYAFGFVCGLEKNFAKQKEENQEWGLVLQVDKDTQDKYDKMNFGKTIRLNPKFKGKPEAFDKGYTDGVEFSMNRIE